MKIIFFITLSILIYKPGFGQKNAQKAELLGYNIAFSGITSGIGAVINTPKDGNKKKAFINGFWQGAIGGFLNFSGKEMLYWVNKENNPVYAWPAKIVHSAGTSIVESAGLKNPFLKKWHINFGALRFDFSTDGSENFKVRLLPYAIVSVIEGSRYGTFSLEKTALTGSIIFQNSNTIFVAGGDRGNSFGRAILIGQQHSLTNLVLAHELVHEFQFNEYQVLNSWIRPISEKLFHEEVKTIFNKYIYADVPYFFLPYFLVSPNNQNSFKNFFEFEAQSSATNSYIRRR